MRPDKKLFPLLIAFIVPPLLNSGNGHSLLLLGTLPPYRASQNPSGRVSIEIRGLASDLRDTPTAQILIERRGASEHVLHGRW